MRNIYIFSMATVLLFLSCNKDETDFQAQIFDEIIIGNTYNENFTYTVYETPVRIVDSHFSIDINKSKRGSNPFRVRTISN